MLLHVPQHAVAAVHHDTNNLAASGILWIGTAGDGTLKVTTMGGDTVSFAAVGTGLFCDGNLRVKQIWSTGTGVSDVFVLY